MGRVELSVCVRPRCKARIPRTRNRIPRAPEGFRKWYGSSRRGRAKGASIEAPKAPRGVGVGSVFLCVKIMILQHIIAISSLCQNFLHSDYPDLLSRDP